MPSGGYRGTENSYNNQFIYQPRCISDHNVSVWKDREADFDNV